MHPIKTFACAILLAAPVPDSTAQNTPPALTGEQIVERVAPSTVLILVGKGDGQVAALGSGLIVRSDGVILTAYHLVKGMREVQVRLRNGEVYDQAELISSDERRDAAALRITATGLAVLPVANSSAVRPGAPVFLVSSGAGLPWSASSGILSATRMADDVPGAGSGYRLLQFTAPLAPGSSGGVIVDAQGSALGMVVGSVSPGQNLNFAVPLESIVGLAAASGGTPFSSGAKLQIATTTSATASGPPARTPATPSVPPDLSLPRPDQLQVRTLNVQSKTIYIRRERLQDDLRRTAMFQQLGLRFADYGERADVQITVDRPFLSFDWTYTLVFQPNDLTLATGLVEAVDEFEAGPKLAAQIMEQLAAAAVLPRGSLRPPGTPAARNAPAARSVPTDAVEVLRTFKTVFVESHTVWMKGNLLQDALYVRPEIREWGIRIGDDRAAAEVYVDVTRPFLTYDWVYKMIDSRSGSVLKTGKVTAIDGPAAAQRLALEIVSEIRKARPLVQATP